MPDYLLTFELAKDGDELLVHADAAGLRYLADALTRLAQCAEAGQKEHTHLMTENWAGHELSSVTQDSEASLLHQVTIHGWPKGGSRDNVA
jgi:Immunity protein 32